eukprot:CFRG6820T1
MRAERSNLASSKLRFISQSLTSDLCFKTYILPDELATHLAHIIIDNGVNNYVSAEKHLHSATNYNYDSALIEEVGLAWRNGMSLYIHCYNDVRRNSLFERWELSFRCTNEGKSDAFCSDEVSKALNFILRVKHHRPANAICIVGGNITGSGAQFESPIDRRIVSNYAQYTQLSTRGGDVIVGVTGCYEDMLNTKFPMSPSVRRDCTQWPTVKSSKTGLFSPSEADTIKGEREKVSPFPATLNIAHSQLHHKDAVLRDKLKPTDDVDVQHVVRARVLDSVQASVPSTVPTSPLRFARVHLQAEQCLTYCTHTSQCSSDCTMQHSCLNIFDTKNRNNSIITMPGWRRGPPRFVGTFAENLMSQKMSMLCKESLTDFSVRIGVYSPSRNSPSITLPFTVDHYDNSPSCKLSPRTPPFPYCGVVRGSGKCSDSRRPGWYRLPKSGSLNIAIFNPNGTPVKVLVVKYDVSDMPPLSKTLLRQKYSSKFAEGMDPKLPVRLRYGAQIVFVSSIKGAIYLSGDLKLAFSNRVDDSELEVTYEYPTNPRWIFRSKLSLTAYMHTAYVVLAVAQT